MYSGKHGTLSSRYTQCPSHRLSNGHEGVFLRSRSGEHPVVSNGHRQMSVWIGLSDGPTGAGMAEGVRVATRRYHRKRWVSIADAGNQMESTDAPVVWDTLAHSHNHRADEGR